MNLIIRAKDILRGLSVALVDELDALITRINFWAGQEHDPQTGQHADVNCTSLTVRATSAGGTSAVPTQTTVGAAGGASALPATPTGYFVMSIGGTEYVLPYYAKS
jgi:hypothetical protein